MIVVVVVGVGVVVVVMVGVGAPWEGAYCTTKKTATAQTTTMITTTAPIIRLSIVPTSEKLSLEILNSYPVVLNSQNYLT